MGAFAAHLFADSRLANAPYLEQSGWPRIKPSPCKNRHVCTDI
jgi:hypothetical protein